MEETSCFFCNSKATSFSEDFNNSFDCNYCGKYCLTKSFVDDYRDGKQFKKIIDQKKYLIAGYLEETKLKRRNIICFDTGNYNKILEDINEPKTTMQKLERLLLYCYKKTEFIGQEFSLIKLQKVVFGMTKESYEIIGDENRIGLAYTKNSKELLGMFNAMYELNWINLFYSSDGEFIMRFSLSTHGLSHAEQLLTTNINSNKVFVAMAFQGNYMEKCENNIKPACKRCGFEAQKVDDEQYIGDIVDRIIVKIKISKFVIADYTYDNSGAYYEAGYADGMGIPVIECCEKAWFEKPENKVHFDKRNNNLILYDESNLEQQLVDRIRATIPGAILEDKTDINRNK